MFRPFKSNSVNKFIEKINNRISFDAPIFLGALQSKIADKKPKKNSIACWW